MYALCTQEQKNENIDFIWLKLMFFYKSVKDGSFIDTDGDGKIDTETVSNAFVGYAPANNPKVTITVTSPDVENPNTSISFHSYVNRRIVKEISNYYFANAE